MPYLPKLDADFPDFAPQTLGDCTALYGESSVPGQRANMHETQKIKRLGFPFSPSRPIGHRKSAKLNQPRLLRVDP